MPAGDPLRTKTKAESIALRFFSSRSPMAAEAENAGFPARIFTFHRKDHCETQGKLI